MKVWALIAVLTAGTAHGASGLASFELPVIGDFMTIQGEGCLVTGDLAKGYFEASLVSCTTDIQLRDKHMREDLETSKYPTAKVELEGMPEKSGKFPLKGTITIKGVKNPLNGEGEMKNGVLTATFKVRLEDFGVRRRVYLGVGVGEYVNVKVEFK